MTPEEQKLFEDFVAMRRADHPLWLFCVVVVACVIIGIGYVAAVFTALSRS